MFGKYTIKQIILLFYLFGFWSTKYIFITVPQMLKRMMWLDRNQAILDKKHVIGQKMHQTQVVKWNE